MNCPGSAATGDSSNATVNSETTQAMKCQVSNLRGFIASLLDCSFSIASTNWSGTADPTNDNTFFARSSRDFRFGVIRVILAVHRPLPVLPLSTDILTLRQHRS